MYCNIRCEGYNEQYGDGRTVYDYYFEDNKFVEYTRGIKLPEFNWDLYEKQEIDTDNVFENKNALLCYIKNKCNDIMVDDYYYNIYIGCNDIELIEYLKLKDETKLRWDYDEDEIDKYYVYPKKHSINCIKKLSNHNTSKKEDIFINICKKYITDLENQVQFTIDSKKYIVDGYSKKYNLIIEFLGDYYHGNPNIYDANYFNNKLKKTSGELYNEWVTRKNMFVNLNYKIIYLWENDYDDMTKKDIHNWVLSKISS